MSFIKQHKYYLLAFVVLLIIVVISGYHVFKMQNTRNNIQGDSEKEIPISISNEIEINEIQAPDSDDQTPNEQIDIIKQNTHTTFTTNTTSTTFINPITLKVADEEYSIEFEEETTVYELMQTLTAMSAKPFSFTGTDYGAGMGYFVDEINGIKNNPQAGKYWIYYVNDDSAKIGISNYIINQGDVIEWKYENTF